MNTTEVKQKDYVSFTGYLNGQKNNGQGLNFDGFLPSLTEDKKGNSFLSGTPNKNTSSDELAKAKNTIKETVANSLGSGKLLSNFDKLTDDALIRGSKTAKETIDNNIKTGKLPSDARETYPYLTDGMTLFYAAGELGLNDVADYSRNLAYTTNSAPKQESNTERQRQENHERARANAQYNSAEWYEKTLKETVQNEEIIKKNDTAEGRSFLDGLSDFLSVASLIPGIDTFINIAQIPVDLARGDYMGALLDVAGALPVIGEFADTAKLARTADNIIDISKATKAFDKMYDVAKGVKRLSPSKLTQTHKLTLSKKQYANLVENIRKNGITEPIKYVEYKGTKYVVDGHHRLMAAKQLNVDKIPAQKVSLPYKGYKTIEDLLWFD